MSAFVDGQRSCSVSTFFFFWPTPKVDRGVASCTPATDSTAPASGCRRCQRCHSLNAFAFRRDVSLRVSQDRVLSPLVELVQLERTLPRGGGGGDVALPCGMLVSWACPEAEGAEGPDGPEG